MIVRAAFVCGDDRRSGDSIDRGNRMTNAIDVVGISIAAARGISVTVVIIITIGTLILLDSVIIMVMGNGNNGERYGIPNA